MDAWLARLERRFGRFVPGNLTHLLIAVQVMGFVLIVSKPLAAALFVFDADSVSHGQLWRLFSWLAIPPSLSPLWVFFALFWLYTIGTTLEAEWGRVKFLLYWLTGVVLTVTAAFVAHAPASNASLLMTLFLAFATLWPDYQIRMFLVVPLKVKWLAFLDGALLLYTIFTAHGLAMLVPIAGVANYLLFFSPTLIARARGVQGVRTRESARSRMRATIAAAELPAVRRCAICGASNEDRDVEIRICDCEKCGGVRRDLCLPHVRAH